MIKITIIEQSKGTIEGFIIEIYLRTAGVALARQHFLTLLLQPALVLLVWTAMEKIARVICYHFSASALAQHLYCCWEFLSFPVHLSVSEVLK